LPKRRGHGGGTVTRRPDGRWQVAVTVGVDARGRQKHKFAYARTKAEAERKLLELLVQYGTGQAADSGWITLAELGEVTSRSHLCRRRLPFRDVIPARAWSRGEHVEDENSLRLALRRGLPSLIENRSVGGSILPLGTKLFSPVRLRLREPVPAPYRVYD